MTVALAEESPDHSGSCMIALHPAAQLAQTLAVDGGLPAAELHVTVAYPGKAPTVDREALITAAKSVTGRNPIEARISGHARFTGGDKGDVIVALVDSADLEDLRRDLLNALTTQGIHIPREHGYTPHCTLTYIPADEASPVDRIPPIPVTFGGISVVHGEDRTDLPFTGAEHPIAAVAREAYVRGWQLAGVPITERACTGAEAAASYAATHADDPDVFEVTLKLGALEGVWATVYKRREALIAAHVSRVSKIWRSILSDLAASDVVRQARYAAGAGPGHITAGRSEATQVATSAARRWLGGVYRDDRYQNLVDAVTTAMHAAAAEGHASALAVAAEMQPVEAAGASSGFPFDVAFDDAYTALDNMTWSADNWVQRIILGNGTDLGHMLGDLLANETPYDEMVSAVEDMTGATDIRAISTLLDQAMSTALNQGAVNLYASEGVGAYDVLTAGDSHVCQKCQDAEADNPHPVTESSPVPMHPMCRCAVAANLPRSAYAQYLPGE